VIRPGRPPRAEDDSVFQARRQAADRKASGARRRALVVTLLWFCGFQLLGTVIAASGFHVQSESMGWALVYLGMFVGNAGSLLAAWYWYFRRDERGDW
jgi:Na+-driven multidrug efflux pump